MTTISALSAIAVRENVVRVAFDGVAYFSGILDPQDASRADKWTATSDPTTSGMDGDPCRPVKVARVEVVAVSSGTGKYLDVVLDRPMSPWPAGYSMSWSGIWLADLSAQTSGALPFLACYRRIEPPSFDAPGKSRDFANPQTAEQATAAAGSPLAALGCFAVGPDGDYASDEGVASLKKRILRRLFTRKGAFAHLPDYGVGLGLLGKQLARPSVLAAARADAETQIGREPEVERCRVRAIVSIATPGIVRFLVLVRTREGKSFSFEVPVLAG